jgi:hypothetical protein
MRIDLLRLSIGQHAAWAHIAGRLDPDLDPEARAKPPQFI